MKAKEYLTQYKKIKNNIRMMESDLKELEEKIKSIKREDYSKPKVQQDRQGKQKRQKEKVMKKEETPEVDIEKLFRQIRKTDRSLQNATDRGDAAAVENLRKKKEQLIGLWYMAMKAQKKPDSEQQRYVQREAQYEGCIEAIMAYTIVLKGYLTDGEELMQRSTVRHAAEDPKERIAEQIEAKNLYTMGLRMAEAITSAYNALTRNLNEPDATTRQQDSTGVLQEEQQDAEDLEPIESEQKQRG